MPERCQSTIVRLFVKDDFKENQAKDAFKAFCLANLGGQPEIKREMTHS